MPTGGKLVGAILFAVLAWFVSDLVKPLLPEGTPTGMLSPINAFIGLLMGWNLMGKGAGKTYRQSIGYGLTTVAATTFWALLLWGGLKMYDRAVKLWFDGPMQALQKMAEFMLEYALLMNDNQVLGTMIVGGIFGGLLTEFFARRWS